MSNSSMLENIFQTSHSIIILKYTGEYNAYYKDEYIPLCPCYGMWDCWGHFNKETRKFKVTRSKESLWTNLKDVLDGRNMCEWMDDYHSDIEDAAEDICNSMIWCEACGSRLVLDPYSEPEKLSRDTALKRHPNLSHVSHLFDEEGWEIYDVALARIMQVTPHNLLHMRPLTEESVITTDIVCKIIKKQLCEENDGDEEKLKELGVRDDAKCDCDSWETYYCKHEKMFSLPVDSYDVTRPSEGNTYPKHTDLAHDGVYVKLLCKSQTGRMFDYVYWGD